MGVWRLPFPLATALPHIAEFPLHGEATHCAFLVTRLWGHPPMAPPTFPLDTEGTVDV